jgi:glyoxylase-like metal-dependent hydrolase (beta-lactamase superfamily II)
MGGSFECSKGESRLQTEKLAEHIFVVLDAKGSNAGVYAGKDAVLAVDAMASHESGVNFRAQIRRVSEAPMARMVLTHGGSGHVSGLSAFRRGMRITAHAAAKEDMERQFRDLYKDVLNDYLPDETFDSSLDFEFEDTQVSLLHFGPAHSAGDAAVHFRRERLVFVGDLLVPGRIPYIHFERGGSALGLHKALKALLALDADVYVPGHGGPCTKMDLEALLAKVEQKLDRVESLVKRGRSLAEIKESLGVTDESLPNGRSYPSFEEAVFRES